MSKAFLMFGNMRNIRVVHRKIVFNEMEMKNVLSRDQIKLIAGTKHKYEVLQHQIILSGTEWHISRWIPEWRILKFTENALIRYTVVQFRSKVLYQKFSTGFLKHDRYLKFLTQYNSHTCELSFPLNAQTKCYFVING